MGVPHAKYRWHMFLNVLDQMQKEEKETADLNYCYMNWWNARIQKGCFLCEVLNKRMPVKGMETFQTADVGASGWSWGRAVGPLPIGKTEVVYGQGLHRLSRVKKKGSREGREKRNRTWQHFVPGTRRWQSALCRPVLCCDKLVLRYLTAGYEDKVRESKGWRCRVAGISWINQHVLAPSDCPPFLFLAVISFPPAHPHSLPTQPPWLGALVPQHHFSAHTCLA